jgi:hypothetical protein
MRKRSDYVGHEGFFSRRWWRLAVGALPAFALLSASAGARAATITWDGGNSGNGTTWNTANNWNPNGVPGSTDDVVINTAGNNISIDTNVNVKSITINGPCTRSIAPAGAQTIHTSGDFTIAPTSAGGSFTLSNSITTVDGQFIHSNGNMTVNGNGGTLVLDSTGTASHTFNSSEALSKVTVGTDLGLVGYWKLDESSGSTIADSSGYANTGTLLGGYTHSTSVPAALGAGDTHSLTFNGSNAYASLGVSSMLANNSPQSISLWVNLTSNANVQNFVAMVNVPSQSGLQVGLRNGNLVTWNWGGGALITGTLPTTGAWHHVVYTWDGTTNRMYLDNTAQTSTTTAHQTASPDNLYFGSYDGVNELLSGSLDDVRVYNRALSAAEVSALFTGNAPTAGTGGTHTFNGTFATAGTLTIGSGTMTGSIPLNIGGSLLNFGTFTDTGAITLSGTGSSNVVLAGGAVFDAVTVSGSGGTYTFADPVSITNSATSNLTIASGATVKGTSAMTVRGNWANSGTFLGTGPVTLTATTTGKTIQSNGGRFSALTVNGSGGAYTLSDRLWVPNGALTMTAGTLNASTFTARVGSFSGAGTFNVGTGTVILDGTNDATLPYASWSGLRMEDTDETSLVGYWKLDVGAGTEVYDASGSGLTGTLSSSGITWAASVPSAILFEDPASVTFNGSTGYANINVTSGLPVANAAQSIAFWAKPASTSNTQVMVNVTAAISGSAVEVGIKGGALAVWNSGGTNLISTTVPSTGVWHHIVYTYNGSSGQTLYVDGVATTASSGNNNTATPTAVFFGSADGANNFYNGSLDDVRIYSVALSSTQVAALVAGRYAGTGGTVTYTLGSSTAVSGLLALDNANLNGNGKTMSASSASAVALVNSGTYTVGSAAQSFSGGLTVNPAGTLTLASSGGSVQIGSGKTLTMNGTLNASSTGATIQSVSGNYAFQVGTASTSKPTLNITGLAVKNTDTNGMQINVNTGSVTTFTKFDNIAFSSGTGAELLQIYSTSLFLNSNGCTFDSGVAATTTASVKLTGNGTGDGETRAVFGASTCASTFTSCQASKSDDDSDNDGVGNTPATNGAVVQFVRDVGDDTAGTIAGMPTAAFSWTTFTYYSTYAAYNNASGTSAIIYVRDSSGNAKYSWTAPAGETIVGTPRWNSVGSTHYLYVAMQSGKVYRLIDNASTSLTLDASWTTNPFNCGCTITTPLAMDTNNLYWGGTSGGQKLWTLGQSSETQPMGSPFTVTPTITSASPALWTNTVGMTTTSYLILGLTGHIIEIDVSGQVNSYDNTNPGTASIAGRIAIGTNGSTRMFAGDTAGKVWAIDPTPANFTGTQKLWVYNGTAATVGSPFYDYTSNTLMYGTSIGTVNSLSSAGAAQTGYPYTPGAASDAISTAPFYASGVLLVGTSTGKLWVIDRNAGSGPAPIRKYFFGSTESVSGIGFDASTNRYMITTSDSTAKDGKLYYIDLVADPTSGSS